MNTDIHATRKFEEDQAFFGIGAFGFTFTPWKLMYPDPSVANSDPEQFFSVSRISDPQPIFQRA